MNGLIAAIEAINAKVGNDPELQLMAATARGLIAGYDARWRDSGWYTVGIPESEFSLPIVNPDTGRTSRTFTHGGKVDGICSFDDKCFLLEHKTCSEDITDPDSPYWRRLDIDAQVSGYMLSNWQAGVKLSGTLYDVIRKPGIRPKAITKEAAKWINRGLYCGQPVEHLAEPGEIESPALYELRLFADTLERSDWYFARKTIYRNDRDILEYARELWETADEIRLARVNNRHFRNSGACMDWGRPCKFLGICSGRDTPDSDKWMKKKQVHSELETIEGDGKSLLTHSRLSTFRTCRRKHFYAYELGIERADKDEEEALYFGRLFHEALSVYWSHLTKENGNDSPVVSEATGNVTPIVS